MLRAVLVTSLINVFICVGVSGAENCSAITKYGIFDVRHTSTQADLADDLLKWMSTNEFNSQKDAQHVGMKTDIIVPYIDVPAHSENNGDKDSESTGTKAAVDFLQTHHDAHLKFTEDFISANSAIISAWKECVNHATGLICWATPTDRPDEVYLNLEVRKIEGTDPPVHIVDIISSPSLKPRANYKEKGLDATAVPLLFSRFESNGSSAGNFQVSTNSKLYVCSAQVPSLPAKVKAELPHECTVDLYGDVKGATEVLPLQAVAGNLLRNNDTLEGTWPVWCPGFKPNAPVNALTTITFSKAGGDNRVSVAQYFSGTGVKGPDMIGTITGSGFSQEFSVPMRGNADSSGIARIGFYLGRPTLGDGTNLTAGPGSKIVITAE